MNTQQALYTYLLRLGDDALILGHRLSEWCSRGPILEEDLALTNMALDQTGRAQVLLQLAAHTEGENKTADDLAYKRGERRFYNHLLCELPNGDFAITMARQWIFSVYEFEIYQALCHSAHPELAAIAKKAIKEIRYHLAHARDWCLRLGNGTAYSHEKMQQAFNELWMYTGELFNMDECDEVLIAEGFVPDKSAIKSKWLDQVTSILTQATLQVPVVDYMQQGGIKGIHTEHLGHLLSEMQYLQRAYPDAKW